MTPGRISRHGHGRNSDNRLSAQNLGLAGLKKQPSRFCHVCASKSAYKRAELVHCGNLKTGRCTKSYCEDCFEKNGWDWNQAKQDDDWICFHCRRACPSNAQCKVYDLINKRVRDQKRNRANGITVAAPVKTRRSNSFRSKHSLDNDSSDEVSVRSRRSSMEISAPMSPQFSSTESQSEDQIVPSGAESPSKRSKTGVKTVRNYGVDFSCLSLPSLKRYTEHFHLNTPRTKMDLVDVIDDHFCDVHVEATETECISNFIEALRLSQPSTPKSAPSRSVPTFSSLLPA